MKENRSAGNRGKGQLLVFAAAFLMVEATLANPVLNNVAAGQATVQQTPGSTVVNQASPKAILNWQSFNIGAAEKTHFAQPAGGIALNRISPNQGASQIFGQLTATGKIILVNQAGIFFGPGSHVDVGGIIASTSDISDANFLAGKYKFDQPSPYNGSIINQGTIHAAQNGLVALIGTGVRNDGTIETHMGNVVLASGNKFTVDLSGDGLVNFTVDEGATSAGVDQNGHALKNGVSNGKHGVILADGGTIVMTAREARGVVDNAINMKGVAVAHSVSSHNGVIILDGGDGNVRVSGRLDTSGKTAGTTGGTIKILARNIHVKPHAVIDVSGDAGGGDVLVSSTNSTRVDQGATILADAISNGNGGHVKVWSDNDTVFSGSISARGGVNGGDGGFAETSGNTLSVSGINIDLRAPFGKTGTWLLDPENLTIQNAGTTTADFASDTYTGNVNNSILTVADLEAALGSASIIVQTGTGGAQAGNLTVADPIYWSNSNSLTLNAYNNAVINASISNTSTGSLNINADTGLNNTGKIQINDGIYLAGGTLTLSAANIANSITTGSAGVVDVYNFTLTQGRWTQTSASNPAFNVANDFQFVDSNTTAFIRTFGTEVIGGTTYNILGDVYGLQGIENGNLGNYSLDQDIDASVTAHWFGGAGFLPIAQQASYTGNFNGQNHVINNLTINRPTDDFVGLFYALSDPVVIKNLGLTNVNLTGGGGPNDQILGGIAAVMQGGTLDNVFVTGVLTQPAVPYTAGTTGVGGLVGAAINSQNDVAIKNSYNAATVTGGDTYGYVGGLIGRNVGGDISTSYNSGTLNGPSPVGGLVGLMQSGSITDSYNIGTVNSTSATPQGGGLISLVVGGPVITNAYSSGLVSGGDTQGGLIYNNGVGATLTNSFWDTDTSGQTYASTDSHVTPLPGTTGINTADALKQNTYTGWDFSGTWYALNYDGTGTSEYIRPILRSEYSTTIRNGHQLELISLDGSKTYTLGNDINLGSAILNKADIWGTDNSSGSGFVSLGTSAGSSAFTGTLNGAGHVIDGLYMNWNSSTTGPNAAPALFGQTKAGSVIENIGLTNVNMTATIGNINVGSAPYAYDMAGTLQQSYATGAVNASSNSISNHVSVGGLVAIVDGGTVTDSYTTVAVTANTLSELFAGGLAGEVASGSTISNSYSTGLITATQPGAHVGGFAGVDDGASTYANNFWNTTSSNTAAGVDDDNIPGVTGLDATGMMQQANFTGWDFTSTNTGVWGIIEGKTAPFLQVINTGLSGTSNTTGAGVGFLVNGVAVSDTALTAGDGSFYVVARTENIPAGSGILAYLTSGGTLSNAVTVQTNSGNTLTGLTLNGDTVTIGDASTRALSNSDAAKAENHSSISNSAILYTSAGPNMTVGNGDASVTFDTTPTTTYTLNGNMNAYPGTTLAYLFGGPVNIGIDLTLQGSTAKFNDTVDGAHNLTLNLDPTFDGAVGQAIPLTSLTVNGSPTIKTSVINTTGDQTYNGITTLAVSSVLSTVSGNIAFNNVVSGTGEDLTLQGAGNNTFTLDTTTHTLALNNLIVHGGSGGSTLQLGTNGPQGWTVIASNTGSVSLSGLTGSGTFDHIANLIGSGTDDTFTLNGGTLSGFIQGGGGSDTIIGDNVTNTWTITGADSGTVTGVGGGFSQIQNLTGGSANDFFTLSGGTLSGAIDGGGGSTNQLTGDNVSNSWTITGVNSGTVTGVGSFSHIGSLVAGNSTNSFTLNGGSLTSGIDGASGTNSLTADNVPNTWNIVATDSGSVTGVPSFAHIQTLIGGSSTDNFVLNGGTISGSIDGGGGNNTLQANNVTNTWSISGGDSGAVTGITGGFTHIQNLTGGTGADNFTFTSSGSLGGNIDGGGGSGVNTIDMTALSTSLNMTLSGLGSARGFAGTTTAVLAGFDNIDNIAGTSSNSNALAGPNLANVWVINGPDAGSLTSTNSFGFEFFQTLFGGSVSDSFTLTGGGTLSGNINGGNSNTTLTVDNGTTSNWLIVNNNTGTVTGLGGDFTGVPNLVGGTGADHFTIVDGVSVSTIDGGGGSGLNSIDLSQFGSNLNITLSALGSSRGFAGTSNEGISTGFDNIDTLTGPGALNNSITGANLSNAWTINGTDSGSVASTHTFNFIDFQNLIGGSGADSFTLSGGTLSGSIDGAGGTNTLTGGNVTNTWNITNDNTGTVTGVSGGFSNIQNLVGGTGNDDFIFNNNDSISGSLNGGAGGTNTLDISAENSALSVNLQTATVSGVVGTTFSNLNNFIGSSSTNDTLTGTNGTHSWNITANNGGNIDNTTTFSSFSNLTGGTGNDTFIFSDGKSIRSLDGGSGTNAMDLSAYTTNVNVNLQTDTATGINTNFSNISSFIGGSGNNTLTGASGTHTWTITAGNGGNIDSSTTFTSFGSLVGGSGADNFVLSGGTLSGSINGSSGSDTLTADNVTNTWNITNNNTGTVTGVTGGFSNIQNLVGGTGNDDFIFNNNDSISGSLNGGAGGTNTLDLSAENSAISVNLQAATVSAVIGTTFSNISNFIGNTANSNASTLTATSSGTHSWSITSQNNSGSLDGTTTFTDFGTLVGGNGDTFTLGAGRTINSISATAGTLDESAYTTAVSVNGGTNTATGVGSMSGITSFIGGSGSNTFTNTTGSNTWSISNNNAGSIAGKNFTAFGTLAGGSGDTFALANGKTISSISATAGTLDESAYTTAVSVNGGTNTATGVSSMSGITSFIGGSASNTFTNTTGGNTWTISNNNTGSIAGDSFSAFGTLTGGSGDSFVFGSSSAAITGNLTGSGSSLNVSGLAAPVVNLATNTSSGIGGTFSGISTFTGGGSNSTLIGSNSNNTWNVTSTNGGSVGSNNFGGFGNLTGGTGTNTFVFTGNGGVSGLIDGGNTTQINTMDFSGYSQKISLVLAPPVGNVLDAGTLANQSSVSIGSFAEMQQVIGTNVGLSTLTLPNTPGITVTYTNPPQNTNGSIADPFQFINMQILNAPTPPAPAPEPPVTIPGDVNNIDNIVITGATAYIVNQQNMDIIVNGMEDFNDSTTSPHGVTVNIVDLINQQNLLTIDLYNKTKFACGC